MIKQDYIIRMIQTIISALAEMLLKKKRLSSTEREEYDGIILQILGITEKELVSTSCDELKDHFSGDTEKWEKLELAAMKMLQIAEESEDPLQKPRLRQNGLDLLKTVQSQANSFSLQRSYLIRLIEFNS